MTLPDLLRALRLRWWVLIIAPIVAAVLAFVISSTMTEMYEAQTTLIIEHQMASGTSDLQSIQAAERRTQTFSQLIRTRSVLEPVVESLDLEIGVGELRESVSVSPVRETQLVTISVQHPDPEQAAKIANEISDRFSAFVRQIQAPLLQESDEDLSGVVGLLSDQVSSTESRIAEFESADDPLSQAEQDELESLRQRLQELEQSRDALSTLESTMTELDANMGSGSQVYVVEAAVAPGAPVSPRVMMNVALAGFLGLLLGGGAVVGVAWLDDNVKTEQDVRRIIDRPVIGTVPLEDLPEQMESIHAGRSISGEIFRGLRTNLQFTMVDRDIRSLVVTSVNPGEGKTTVATNLAIVLAQGGQRVILVDADMRRPQVHSRFHRVRNDRGLSNLLLQSPAVIENMIQSTTINNLKILATGPLPPNPPDLFGSSRMKALLSALEETADIVVFDAPPLAISESLLLSSLVDGIIFVVRAGKNRTGEIVQGFESAQQTGVPILGVVLNGVPRDSQAAHRVYQQYYPLVGGQGEMPAPKARFRWVRRLFGRAG